ncbi:MAG: AraC family transcriptional regulator [Rikenellaceae bacterium]
MEIKSINNLFEVEIQDLEAWSGRPHMNNFFEIVYIESGSGVQCINYNEAKYSGGNIFLLPPLNCHRFKIEEQTKFYFIKFTDNWFKNNKMTDNDDWFSKIACILASYNRVPGDIISSQSERQTLIGAIKSIHAENMKRDKYSDSIQMGSIVSILNILARNIEAKFPLVAECKGGKICDIMRYINDNITDNTKLKSSVIAEHFGISERYMSDYFKRHSDTTLSEYINKVKIRLSETYLLHSNLSLKEIAYRLNFTDSSHFSKCFKRHYGVTIKEFKLDPHICYKQGVSF